MALTIPNADQLAPNSLARHPDLAAAVQNVIDAGGDLFLLVGLGADKTAFKVISTQLIDNSPVFRAMLAGNFMEGRDNQTPGEVWLVNLPDDKPHAMESILRLAHKQWRVIHNMTAEQLLDVFTHADKYMFDFDIFKPAIAPWRGVFTLRTDELLRVVRVKNINAAAVLRWAWEMGRKRLFR
jgi:hypothetical protein